jgi:hypothetical protein
MIGDRLGLKSVVGMSLFVKIADKVMSVPDGDFFFDFVRHHLNEWLTKTEWAKETIPTASNLTYQVFFLKKIWSEVVIGEDENADNLFHYHQELPNLLRGYHDPSMEEIVDIAALVYRVKFGDDESQFEQITSIISELVPVDCRANKSAEEWKTLIVTSFNKHAGKGAPEAKGLSLKIMQRWPTFGSAFFEVVQHTKPKFPRELTIAINKDGVTFINPADKAVLVARPFSKISNWSCGTSTFHIGFGNLVRGSNFLCGTNLGYKMDDLLTSYISEMLVTKRASGGDGGGSGSGPPFRIGRGRDGAAKSSEQKVSKQSLRKPDAVSSSWTREDAQNARTFVFNPTVAYARTFPSQDDYWVTEKVDGVRMCLRITRNGRKSSGMLITMHEQLQGKFYDSDEDYDGECSCYTVTDANSIHLDGELVRTPLGLAFIICDIASCGHWDGVNLSATPVSVMLTERMKSISKILKSCSITQYIETELATSRLEVLPEALNARQNNRLLLITKKYHHVSQTSELLDRSRYIYAIDGLIFAPKRTSAHVCMPTLKWKPAYKMTLDLVFDRLDSSLIAVGADGKTTKLNFSGVDNMLSIQERKRADVELQEFGDTTVAEFLWNRLCHKWVFIRRRPDRSRPNSLDEVNFVLFEAAQHDYDIREMMQAAYDSSLISDGETDEDVYEESTFGGYNRAVKHLLFCAVGGERIADLGCGPAKDLERWRAAGASFVLAVDADEASIDAAEELLKRNSTYQNVRGCRRGVHKCWDSGYSLTVQLAHGDLRDTAGPLKDAVLASIQRMGEQEQRLTAWRRHAGTEPLSLQIELDTVFCNFAIHYFVDADLQYIFDRVKPGGKLIVTYMESEKIVAPIMTPALRVELDAESSERLMVTVATIGKVHSEARVDRASLIARCREWGLICEGFIPFGSFASILGPPSMETTLYCCAVFRRPCEYELENKEKGSSLDDTVATGVSHMVNEFPSFDRVAATNFPVRVALETDGSNKVLELLQKAPLCAAVMFGYNHTKIFDILKAFQTITSIDQLTAINTWLEVYGCGELAQKKQIGAESHLETLKVLLNAKGDDALASVLSTTLKTSIEMQVCADVIKLLTQLGATFESSATAVKKLCVLPYNAIDILCERGLISNICAQDSKKTGLMIACALGRGNCVQSFLKHGSDPNEKDIYGSTAWDYAKRIQEYGDRNSDSSATIRRALSAATIACGSVAQCLAPETKFCGAFPASQMRLLRGGNTRFYFRGGSSEIIPIFTAILCAVRNSVTSKDLGEGDEWETGLTMTDSGSIISRLPWELWEVLLTFYAATCLEKATSMRARRKEQEDEHERELAAYERRAAYREQHPEVDNDRPMFDRYDSDSYDIDFDPYGGYRLYGGYDYDS